jgi:glycosyltransferase involved in cell wall biosynthesis
MGTTSISVLHVDSEPGWRGGQQQAAYLLSGMHRLGYEAGLVSPPGSALASYCEEQNLTHYEIPIRGELDLVAAYRVASLCRTHGYRCLHLHSAHALTIGLWAKLLLPSLLLIAVRRVDFHIAKNWLSRLKYTSSLLDRIVCISEKIQMVLREDGIPEAKLVTIPSGVDLDKYRDILPSKQFLQQFGISEDHFVVGTVAAMVGHKDYPNLLNAARIVLEQRSDVTFCAVGSGPDQKEVIELAGKLNLGSSMVFTGFRSDVGHFLRNFDLFVLASKYEGLGTSILDAQAAGLPVVACSAGGISQIITHGQNGLLVPPRDPEALAEAILDVMSNGDKRRALAENALISVRRFNIDGTIEQNIALYQQLLRGGPLD